MVCQMPFADKKHLFAASNVEDEAQARRELQTWARAQGYEAPKTERIFTTFRADSQPREWVLLERNGAKN